MKNEGISIFGTRFVAEVDFQKALEDARTFQGVIKAIPDQIREMVNQSKAHLAELTAAFNEASAAASQVGAGGAVSGGVAGGGSPPVGAASGLLWITAPQSSRAASSTTPRQVLPPAQRAPVGMQRGIDFNNALPPSGPAGYLWSGSPGLPPHMLPPPRYGAAVPYQGPVAAHPYYAGYTPAAAPYSMAGGAVPGTHFSPSNQMVHVPPSTYAQGGYRGAGFGMEMVHLPGQGAIPADFWPRTNPWGGRLDTATAFTARFRNIGAGIGNVFNYQNMMRLAAGLYVGQNIANVAAYAGRQTIGEAMYLEERQRLLENALMSDKLNITRDHARARSVGLTEASYFAGMPVTAQEMGLSRVELAEQFRQLAPIVRLTAQTQDEFQAGLQTGALARALLVARDPVQGTKGSMVALSELYSGGPDRFRSLALRFELPRNRLLEIEQEHGGADVADPGQVLIQMLSEMGFGPNYLVMRAGTLAGQLDRTGALYENFRVDLYADAMTRVRDNLTRLNDSFERFLDSDAGDAAISRLDRIFGSITGLFTNSLSNLMTGGLASGPMDAVRTARHVGEYMQVRGGEFTTATGQIISAGEAFQEAAQMITGKQFAQAMRSAAPNPNLGLLGMTAGGAAGIVGGMGLLNRFLLAGQGSGVVQALLSGGWGAAGSAALTGFMGSAALPIMGAAAVAGYGALAWQSAGQAREWRDLRNLAPDFASQYNLPMNANMMSIGQNRIDTFLHNLNPVRRLGRGIFEGTFGRGWARGDQPGMATPGFLLPRISQAENIAAASRDWDIVSPLLTSAYMTSLENDSMVTRAGVMAMVDDFLATTDNPEQYDLQQVTGWIDFIMNTVEGSDRTTVGTMLSGVVATRAAMGGLTMVGPDGYLISDNPAVAGSSSAGLSEIWQSVLGRTGGDQEAALDYLKAMLENLAQISENTEALAEAASASAYIRPSFAGDIFTGFIENPDMRFTRRSGMPRAAAATTTLSGTAGGTRVGGLTYSVAGAADLNAYTYDLTAMEYPGYLAYESFFGTMTDYYGRRRANGSIHGGIDYVRRPGEGGHLVAPYDGTIEILQTAEDYARYPGMFGVADPNRDQVGTYGVTAIFRDSVAGTMSTYSHLSHDTISLYGADTRSVTAGQKFAVQGNTGYTIAENGGDGTHVHQEFWVPDESSPTGFTRINPMHAPGYFAQLPSVEQGIKQGATVNISMDNQTFNISQGDARSPEEIVDALLSNPQYRAALVGSIAAGLAQSPSAAVGVMRAANGALARRGQAE